MACAERLDSLGQSARVGSHCRWLRICPCNGVRWAPALLCSSLQNESLLLSWQTELFSFFPFLFHRSNLIFTYIKKIVYNDDNNKRLPNDLMGNAYETCHTGKIDLVLVKMRFSLWGLIYLLLLGRDWKALTTSIRWCHRIYSAIPSTNSVSQWR